MQALTILQPFISLVADWHKVYETCAITDEDRDAVRYRILPQ